MNLLIRYYDVRTGIKPIYFLSLPLYLGISQTYVY